MKALVIIPAFNEAHTIEKLIQRLSRVKPALDILVINDASQDNTSALAHGTSARVVDSPVNLGIGGAMQTGYLYAWRHNYDAAIQTDGDGQHDPGFISRLLAPLAADQADLVIGSRFLDVRGFQSSWPRRLGINLIRILLHMVTGQRFSDPTSGFRAANRRVIALFANYYPADYPEPESLVMLCRHKMRIAEVKVVMQARESGSSSIIGWATIYYMFKVCLAIIVEKLKKRRA